VPGPSGSARVGLGRHRSHSGTACAAEVRDPGAQLVVAPEVSVPTTAIWPAARFRDLLSGLGDGDQRLRRSATAGSSTNSPSTWLRASRLWRRPRELLPCLAYRRCSRGNGPRSPAFRERRPATSGVPPPRSRQTWRTRRTPRRTSPTLSGATRSSPSRGPRRQGNASRRSPPRRAECPCREQGTSGAANFNRVPVEARLRGRAGPKRKRSGGLGRRRPAGLASISSRRRRDLLA
jgi:hypothetical protein